MGGLAGETTFVLLFAIFAKVPGNTVQDTHETPYFSFVVGIPTADTAGHEDGRG